MTDTQMSDAEADTELKGKGFDEVCDAIKNDELIVGAVHKKPDGGAGRWSYCFGFRADEYSEADLLDLIVAEYGPGTYPIQFKGKQKNGRPRFVWQKHFHVQSRRRAAAQNLSAAPTAPAPAPANDALAAAMERQAVALEALAASIARPPPEVKTTIDFVQDLAAIKDLFSDNQRSALEQFRDAMELRKLIKDDDGNGATDPLSVAMKALTPAIEKGVEALQEREAAQFSRPGAPAPEAAPEVAPLEPGAEPADQMPTSEHINEGYIVYAFQFISEKYLPAIMQTAEAGQDPGAVAEYFVRLIGDDEKTIQLLGIVLSQDDMVLRFSRFNARVLQFTAWLDCVGDNLAHALWPATNPPAEAFNATIDATIDATDGGGGINDAESTGAEPADVTASGESIPDAKPSPDSPGKGHDNDA